MTPLWCMLVHTSIWPNAQRARRWKTHLDANLYWFSFVVCLNHSLDKNNNNKKLTEVYAFVYFLPVLIWWCWCFFFARYAFFVQLFNKSAKRIICHQIFCLLLSFWKQQLTERMGKARVRLQSIALSWSQMKLTIVNRRRHNRMFLSLPSGICVLRISCECVWTDFMWIVLSLQLIAIIVFLFLSWSFVRSL